MKKLNVREKIGSPLRNAEEGLKVRGDSASRLGPCWALSGAPLRFRSVAGTRGFTLIELMMVLTVISILVSIAIPIANSAIIRSKEAVLRSNLYTLRTLIDQYTADKLKAPQSLDDLVTAGYLRSLPKDPITDRNDTWQIVMEDASLFPEQTETGVFDVHSGSTATSSDGRSYSEW